jgi:hypothetical protein
LIGHVVWWSQRDVAVSPDGLARVMNKYGLDAEFLPPLPAMSSTLRQVVQRHKASRDQVVHLIASDHERVVYGVVDAKVISGEKTSPLVNALSPEELKLGLVAKIVLEVTSGHVTVLGVSPLADKIAGRYNELAGRFLQDSTRRLMETVLEAADGLALRATGGVFFVPAHGSDLVLKLAKVVHGFGATMSCLPQYKATDTIEALSSAASGGLEVEINSLLKSLDDFNAENARPAAVENRLKHLSDLEARTQMFVGILNLNVDQLTQRLADKKQLFAAALGIATANAEEKKEERKRAAKARMKTWRQTPEAKAKYAAWGKKWRAKKRSKKDDIPTPPPVDPVDEAAAKMLALKETAMNSPANPPDEVLDDSNSALKVENGKVVRVPKVRAPLPKPASKKTSAEKSKK